MSSIHRTTIHAYTTPTTASAHHTSKKKTTSTPVAATRANTAPPKLEMANLNYDLKLTESQRNQIRPIVTADERKQTQISKMHWSSPALALSTLWQARDDTTKKLQHALDPKQFEKLKASLGPTS